MARHDTNRGKTTICSASEELEIMKVTVIPSWRINTWSVKLSQGVQSFHLVYCGTKADATWYAKMFRKALSAHDAEKHKLLEATCAKVLQ
jgi:hypothetical protein